MAPHADVSELDLCLGGDLTLNREVHLIDAGGLEAGIQFRIASRRRIGPYAGKEWLRQGLGHTRKRRGESVRGDAKCVRGVDTRRSETLSTVADADTSDRLPDSGTLERNLHLVDAVDPVKRSAVTGPDHGLARREQLAQDADVKFRTPGHRHARAQAAVVRLEGVLRMSGDVADCRRADYWIVDLSCKRGLLPL